MPRPSLFSLSLSRSARCMTERPNAGPRPPCLDITRHLGVSPGWRASLPQSPRARSVSPFLDSGSLCSDSAPYGLVRLSAHPRRHRQRPLRARRRRVDHLQPSGRPACGRRGHPKRTFFGISAIAFGYLLYAGAIAQYGAALGSVRLLVLSLWLLVGALAARTVLLRTRRRNPKQASAAVAYTLLLFAAVGFATGLALTAPRFGVLAVGALLLASSDLILLFELSVCPSLLPDSPPSGEGKKGWLLPWFSSAARLLRAPGQALIVVSIWSALQDPISSQFSVFGS